MPWRRGKRGNGREGGKGRNEGGGGGAEGEGLGRGGGVKKGGEEMEGGGRWWRRGDGGRLCRYQCQEKYGRIRKWLTALAGKALSMIGVRPLNRAVGPSVRI